MIRAALPSDHHYIVDSWIGSYGDSAVAKSMTEGLYKARWFLLASTRVRTQHVAILADDESPGVIKAWLCHDGAGTMHYVHVRKDFRRMGHARELIASVSPRLHAYSARTVDWQRASSTLANSWTYDPGRLWFPDIISAVEGARSVAPQGQEEAAR